MDKRVENDAMIDLTSLVNSHAEPFVVIDKDYQIIAVNEAYATEYGASKAEAVGKYCYQVSHGNERPCNLEGEDCPHEHVFHEGEARVCTHIHCDAEHHMHQVKISAVPLRGPDNTLYLGESISEIPHPENTSVGNDRMVGESAEFIACLDQLTIAAGSDAPVLLQGETGTGKELAAEFIHKHSDRCTKPFQIVDSTVLTDSLFESEMFGHVNGAYTGSTGDKQGLFELAEGGTIFLDEIGDLPASQQAKLLRVLESGQYRRVGGKNTRRADVRVICATNRHLWESVLAGQFREDLYYRIACLNIRLPNLRDRLDDIPVLAQNLLEGINRSMRCSYRLVPDVYDCLKTYKYPGNVRELRNILFIAATHSLNREINAALITKVLDNLPHCVENANPSLDEMSHVVTAVPDIDNVQPGKAAPETLKNMEEQYIRDLLARYQGNRKKVADALGISERTVYRKLKNLGIN